MKTKKMFIGLGAAAALGAAIVPMASYAASDSDNVAINLRVGSTISMNLEGTSISPSIFNNGSSTDLTTVATVTTNSSTGYSLSASTSSDDGTLLDNDTSETIAYVGANFTAADEGWALSIPGETEGSRVYKAISGNTISGLAYSAAPVDSDDTTVTYNFKTAGDTVSGEYKTTLTYTATTN